MGERESPSIVYQLVSKRFTQLALCLISLTSCPPCLIPFSVVSKKCGVRCGVDMAVLTDAKARAIRPGDIDLPDGAVKGLWLESTAKKGHGHWMLRYVSPVTTTRREMGLGPYPEVSIVEARHQANAARDEIRRGQDPINQRKAAREVAGSAMTFEQAALRMYDQIRTGLPRKRKFLLTCFE